jgi:hypothetical protein
VLSDFLYVSGLFAHGLTPHMAAQNFIFNVIGNVRFPRCASVLEAALLSQD